MTDDRSSAHPSSSSSASGDGDSRPVTGANRVRPSIAIVTSLADAADVSPLELPPLNETVEVDALDSLFVDGDGSVGEHEHEFDLNRTYPTATFRYAGHDVQVDANSSVALLRSETAADGTGDWTHVSPVDVPADYELTTRLVLAVADRIDREPARIRSELEATVDLDALSRLNRRRANGIPRPGATVRFSRLGLDIVVTPDGTIAIGSTLTRLKRTGGNVLIAGAVPDALVDAASAKLLGDPGPDADRQRCVALLDRNVDVVARRLPETATTTRVVTHATTARSAAASPAVADSTDGDARTDVGHDPTPTDAIDVTTVTGDLEDVRTTIETMVTERATDPGLEPSALRLCVDSLRPVLDGIDHGDSDDHDAHEPAQDRDDAIAFLTSLCETVRDVSGLAHYVLPIDRQSPSIRRLEPLFDATIELRLEGTTPQQRWHLHECAYTTDWFELGGAA